jgi:hypothetical protein
MIFLSPVYSPGRSQMALRRSNAAGDSRFGWLADGEHGRAQQRDRGAGDEPSGAQRRAIIDAVFVLVARVGQAQFELLDIAASLLVIAAAFIHCENVLALAVLIAAGAGGNG